MARLVNFTGPEAPDGPLGWCTVCAALYKAEAVHGPLADKLKIAAGSDGPEMRLPVNHLDGTTLQPAVAYGIYPPLGPPAMGGNGLMTLPVPLCWSHLMGVQMTNGVMPASPQQMAMMNQNVPLLGQGNR